MLPRLLSRVVLVLWVCGTLFATDPSGIWLDVPFVKQKKDGCGAASIAMVMQYWQQQQGRSGDANAEAAQIQRALHAHAAPGIYASAMQTYFQRSGYRVFAFRGDWRDLEQHLKKGRPLIAAVKPGSTLPLHYVVVAGLDQERQLVLLNDPAERKLLKEDRSRFELEWNAAGGWTLLAVPETGSHSPHR
jgi:ABC-type bacteriocin/lantibiotic exporter with double-glycine peptidase domain